MTEVLSQQKYSCDKQFCHDKSFVTTSILLSSQKMFCCNKHVFVATKLLSQQKWYLLQLPPMTAYCILYNWGQAISCIHRKDALSTQCSHKPAYCILYLHTAFSATEGKRDKLHSQEGCPKYPVLTQTCILHSLPAYCILCYWGQAR